MLTAAKLLAESSAIGDYRDAAIAAANGTAPLPASSGQSGVTASPAAVTAS